MEPIHNLTPESAPALHPSALASCLLRLTAGWSREDMEDGGLIHDHLSDICDRDALAAIPVETWDAAWRMIAKGVR
jgi:hypothetical protein